MRLTRSFMTPLSNSVLVVPLTNTAVLPSSTSFGSFAARARFERAFRGFLHISHVSWVYQVIKWDAYTVRSMAGVFRGRGTDLRKIESRELVAVPSSN